MRTKVPTRSTKTNNSFNKSLRETSYHVLSCEKPLNILECISRIVAIRDRNRCLKDRPLSWDLKVSRKSCAGSGWIFRNKCFKRICLFLVASSFTQFTWFCAIVFRSFVFYVKSDFFDLVYLEKKRSPTCLDVSFTFILS